MFGAVKRVLLGVSRCLALQPDHTTLAPELPLPGYRRKETETVIAQLLENSWRESQSPPAINSQLRKAGLLAQYSPDSRFFSRSCNATRDIFTYANQKTDTDPSPGAHSPNVLILADRRVPATIEGDIQMTMFRPWDSIAKMCRRPQVAVSATALTRRVASRRARHTRACRQRCPRAGERSS